MATTKRTRLRPVYLTDTERDLLINGMVTLRAYLRPELDHPNTRPANFAKSYTARRIDEVVELLRALDKPAPQAAA